MGNRIRMRKMRLRKTVGMENSNANARESDSGEESESVYLIKYALNCIQHWINPESYPSPLTDCDDYGDYVQGSALLSSLCGVQWRNQDQEQIQNVFKRFLFHYSKAHNSVGSVERESHSVHPLMRLSPKLSLRRKKQRS
ncbi:neuromedin-S isoform X2 [Megalobrama amblycephala]|uniref:neuromedin-S isoform X2 n=1 Tax=Megalobrama amblycephala TaxID=75352 RepID=UPI00201468CF|nr:neuromedin-S isoform X2 [Megalobrama amblycephala]